MGAMCPFFSTRRARPKGVGRGETRMEDGQEQHGGGEEPPASTEPTVSARGRRGRPPVWGEHPQFGGGSILSLGVP